MTSDDGKDLRPDHGKLKSGFAFHEYLLWWNYGSWSRFTAEKIPPSPLPLYKQKLSPKIKDGESWPRSISREETVPVYENWREAQSKMAAADWSMMEPFIQLTYSEQCPQKTLQLTETSFIDKRKIPKNFWSDLLEKKCPEGALCVFLKWFRCLCTFSA